MQLHYAPGTVAVAVALGLEEAGLDYAPVAVDFASGEQTRAPYHAINPKGRVPALVLEDGTVMTETGAILDYIADVAPRAGLRPENAVDRQHVRAVMYYLASTMHVAHAHRMRGARWADSADSWADMAAKVPQTMTACAAFVETGCLRGTYTTGETFGIADCYLFAVCRWLEGDGVALEDFPRIATFLRATAARDSVAALERKGIL